MTNSELSIAPGRTLATMFLTVSDVTDDVIADDRPSVSSSEALMMTPDDVASDRGRGTVE